MYREIQCNSLYETYDDQGDKYNAFNVLPDETNLDIPKTLINLNRPSLYRK